MSVTKKAIHQCVRCGTGENVTLIAHRNEEGYVVGWLVSCVNCIEEIDDTNLETRRGTTTENRLQRLYQSEINGSISWFFDGLVTVKLGDDMNGIKDEHTFNTIAEAVDWLWAIAKEAYPDCELWQ